MNIIKKSCISCIAMLCMSVSIHVSAYNLDVLVVFDSKTTHFSGSQMDKTAKDLLKKLNASMANSNLGSALNFNYRGRLERDVMQGKNFKELQSFYDSTVRTSFSRNAVLPIHKLQKQYRADVVIVVTNPKRSWFETPLCGWASGVPTQSNRDPGMSSSTLLTVGHYSPVFITATSKCLEDKIVVAHEVGHTFGLSHGFETAQHTGDSSHYSSDLIKSYAGGYGDFRTSNAQYYTVMAGASTDWVGKYDNVFSDKQRYTCGPTSQSVCGSDTANARSYLLRYAKKFSQRSEWYE